MTKELDERLIPILDELAMAPSAAVNDAIKRIKQAFEEAGYVSPENAKKVQEMVNQMANLANDAFHLPTIHYIKPNKAMTKAQSLMTGQEWYERLIKEVDHEKVSWLGNSSKEYIEAAKRASGLSEEEK